MTVMLTGRPATWPAVKSTVGGSASRIWMTTKNTPPATARNDTSRATARASTDTSHHLASQVRITAS